MKPIWPYCFCLFHSHDPKPMRNHQIPSSRTKTRSRRSQTCVKHRGIVIFITRNSDVNRSDLKLIHNKMSKEGWFSRRYLQFQFQFATMIWGSLIVSPLLWFLSSCKTFFCNSFRHCLIGWQKVIQQTCKTSNGYHRQCLTIQT